jgi:hypothetical protein
MNKQSGAFIQSNRSNIQLKLLVEPGSLSSHIYYMQTQIRGKKSIFVAFRAECTLYMNGQYELYTVRHCPSHFRYFTVTDHHRRAPYCIFVAVTVNGTIFWWSRGHDPRFTPLFISNIILVLDSSCPRTASGCTTSTSLQSYKIPHTHHSHLLKDISQKLCCPCGVYDENITE